MRKKNFRQGQQTRWRKESISDDRQNLSFKAHCSCREEPESAVGKRVLATVENVFGTTLAGDMVMMLATLAAKGPGWPKLG